MSKDETEDMVMKNILEINIPTRFKQNLRIITETMLDDPTTSRRSTIRDKYEIKDLESYLLFIRDIVSIASFIQEQKTPKCSSILTQAAIEIDEAFLSWVKEADQHAVMEGYEEEYRTIKYSYL